MFCKYCGARLDSEAQFCSSCGYRILEEHHPNQNLQNSPKRRLFLWFKAIMTVIVLGLIVAGIAVFLSENLTDAVEGQLKSLKGKKITEAYYNYTSKDFQAATSLDIFHEFVRSYPIFTQVKSLNINDQSIENNIGTINTVLISAANERMSVEYKLIKEGERWKILSIKLSDVAKNPTTKPADPALMKELSVPIEEQFQALRAHDIGKAYGLGSKEFAKETSLQQYETFIQENPILSDFKEINYENFSSQGNKGYVTLALSSDEGQALMEYTLQRENGNWKIWSLRIIPSTSEISTLNGSKVTSLIQLVKDQLADLKSSEINKAYEVYVAKPFKEATSFQAFRDFVHRYPILTTYTSLNFGDPKVVNEIGKLRVELHKNDSKTTLEYTLGVEENKWKIWGMRVIKNAELPSAPSIPGALDPDFNSKELSDVIQGQLEQVRQHDLAKSYKDYTSKEFQKATSLEEFENFINNQPGFYDNVSLDLNKLTFNNNIGTFSGIMSAKDGEKFSIEYDLIKEGGKWKIMHIQIVPHDNDSLGTKNEEKDTASPMDIAKFLIGNKVDLQGLVIDPTTTVKSDSGDIFVNMFVHHGSAGNKVELRFQHLDSKSSISPISTSLDQNGDSIISFVFSPPTGGWPKGNYRIEAESSSGAHKIVDFKVE
jgi:Domain of unknown function (DUF4864)/zinc-ribbon domain